MRASGIPIHNQKLSHAAVSGSSHTGRKKFATGPATPPEYVEQFAADVALVGEELARKMAGHLVQHGAGGGVAGGDGQRHDLAFVVDHEGQLEAVEPSHAGLAARGQAIEDLMAVDAAIVADGELGWIHEVDAGLLAAEAVEQHRKG